VRDAVLVTYITRYRDAFTGKYLRKRVLVGRDGVISEDSRPGAGDIFFPEDVRIIGYVVIDLRNPRLPCRFYYDMFGRLVHVRGLLRHLPRSFL